MQMINYAEEKIHFHKPISMAFSGHLVCRSIDFFGKKLNLFCFFTKYSKQLYII